METTESLKIECNRWKERATRFAARIQELEKEVQTMKAHAIGVDTRAEEMKTPGSETTRREITLRH